MKVHFNTATEKGSGAEVAGSTRFIEPYWIADP